MSKVRDIARFLGKTEASNTTNARLLTVGEGGLDSAAADPVIEAAAGTIDYYTSLDSLPTTNLVANTRAFVESNSRYYISNGSGWYNVALVNLSPTMTLDQSGTITLAADGTATVVTITATDSDNPLSLLSYSVESDGNGIGNFSVSQDSSVFTIAALSEDSGAQAAEFTLTFKTTDRINTATADLDFSLSFSNVVDSSAPTVLLIKADGNNAVNGSRTFINSGGTESTLNLGGSSNTSSMSPYRSGGYSAYFDGSGDFLSVPSSDVNIKTLSASNFTVEGWFYKDDTTKNIFLFGQRGASGTSYSGIQLAVDIFGYMALLGATDLSSWDVSVTGSTLVSENEWHHFAVVKNSTTYTLYLDGASQGTSTAGTLVYASGNPALVIGTVWSSSSSQYDWHGYIKDFRVSDNARYTTAFTPPTEPFESDSNTELLACSLPYFGDISSTDATITTYGDTKTLPFGPYDYEPWVEDNHSTSLHFNGSTIMYNTVGAAPGTGDFTYEGWARCPDTTTGTNQYIFDTSNDGFGTGGVTLYVGGEGKFGALVENGGVAAFYVGTTKIYYDNTWFHFAMVRNSGSLTFYLNGKVVSGPFSYTRNLSSTDIRLGASNRSTPSNYFEGQIANFRITNSAVYTAAFTSPTAPLETLSNNQFLLNPTPNIYDAAASRSFDLIGGTVSNTSVRKFTTSSSIAFPGSGGTGVDGIQITDELGPMSKDQFLTSDFTIEFWMYPTSWNNNDIFIGYDVAGGNTASWMLYQNSGMRLYADNDTDTSWDLVNYGTVFSVWTNSWKHFAMTYDASAQTLKVYIDGTQEYSVGSITGWENGGSFGDYNTLVINQGVNQTNRGAMVGYIQDVRVSKSVRYTSAFTPPTAEFEL